MEIYILEMEEEYDGVGYGSLRAFAKKEDMLKVKEQYKDFAIHRFDSEEVDIYNDGEEEGFEEFVVAVSSDTYIRIMNYKKEVE